MKTTPVDWLQSRALTPDLLSAVYPPEIKPVHRGVYYVQYEMIDGVPVWGWCPWLGYGWGIATENKAGADSCTASGYYQRKHWMGLTREVVG